MEKQKIYIISMSTGSYDSFSVEHVAITDNFEKAEQYVNNKNKNFESMEKKLDSFYKNEYAQWHKDNPQPNYLPKNLLTIPKWESNQKITQEMRDHRKDLELKNHEIISKANQPRLNWNKDLQDYTENWAKTNLTEEEMLVYTIRNENSWYFEEAIWL